MSVRHHSTYTGRRWGICAQGDWEGPVVEIVRKAWNEETPDSFKATLVVFAWGLAGVILTLT
jgi:hypothetical protein